jgi:hypothetical protein
MEEHNNKYKINIYERYTDLKNQINKNLIIMIYGKFLNIIHV